LFVAYRANAIDFEPHTAALSILFNRQGKQWQDGLRPLPRIAIPIPPEREA
jgi:hypothetical protein